jgi:hypothetical protein
MKKDVESKFPNSSLSAQKNVKSNILRNMCGFNEKLFFGIKKKLIDYQKIEERADNRAVKLGEVPNNTKVVIKPEKL